MGNLDDQIIEASGIGGDGACLAKFLELGTGALCRKRVVKRSASKSDQQKKPAEGEFVSWTRLFHQLWGQEVRNCEAYMTQAVVDRSGVLEERMMLRVRESQASSYLRLPSKSAGSGLLRGGALGEGDWPAVATVGAFVCTGEATAAEEAADTAARKG